MDNKADLVKTFVKRRIAELTNSENEAAVRAKLANLRRGIGKAPGSLPKLWDVTLEGMPEVLYSRDGTPTQAEWAVYTALTLFALHQQGRAIKQEPMSMENMPLGAAVHRLVRSEEDIARVKRRFDAAVTAEDIDEFVYHLRGIVQLLKSEGIPLDYPALAAELYFFQFDGARDKVRLRWGQDFFCRREAEDKAAADA